MRSTRRAFLAGTGTVLGGIAGCLGGGSEPSSPDTQTTQGARGCTLKNEAKVQRLPTPALGGGDVTVKVWEDFACPHCARFALEVFPKLRSEYIDSGRIRYEHHDFPIPVDQKWSWAAANAARGVQDTTDDVETFYEYTHELFRNQGSYSMSLITKLANDVGAPGCDVQSDAVYNTYQPVLKADRQAGKEAGVSGTPGVFVNGSSVEPSYEAVRSAVESAL